MIKQTVLLFCFLATWAACKRDDCFKKKEVIEYKLDKANFWKIPFKDYDTVVFKLVSTGDTVTFIAGKWALQNPYYDDDCNKPTVYSQYRSLIFTCRNNNNFNGYQIVINHYIDWAGSKKEKLNIDFHTGRYEIDIDRIGNNYQVDSVTIQGITYHDVNFIGNGDGPFPFGCFYSTKYGILKMHRMDKDWPVPQGGEPWELLKK
jgi:hypothetical protein